jgi:oligopeptide/dipeptide ABC transporter ATP-binding protein
LRTPVLRIENLTACYPAACGPVRAVRSVSLDVAAGEATALVGETGCGKSTLALAATGLLSRGAWIESGEVYLDGHPTAHLTEAEWSGIRGAVVGIVFQDARGTLNPVLTVGRHLIHALCAHRALARGDAARRAAEILAEVGVPNPEFFMDRYASELSGGLCQRVAIALAICNGPQLLVADEPTSAIDPTLQAQILQLLRDLQRRRSLAVLLISHDLALVSQYADRVAVMYHGRLVEYGTREEVLGGAAHPYTRALIESLPEMATTRGALQTIPGAPPPAGLELPGCAFMPRCSSAGPECVREVPSLRALSGERRAACLKACKTEEEKPDAGSQKDLPES